MAQKKLNYKESSAEDYGFKLIKESKMFSRYLLMFNREIEFPKRDSEKKGKTFAFDVTSHKNPYCCIIFPFHSNKTKKGGKVTMIREYSQGLHTMIYSLPAGGYDKSKHLKLTDCVKHELSEEAHLRGGEIIKLIPDNHPGIAEVKWCKNRFIPFLVIDPENDDSPLDTDPEEFIKILTMNINEIKNLVLTDDILPPSLVTINLAMDYLREHNYL